MTKEGLFKPRYKVISDYPNSDFSVGDVIQSSDWGFWNLRDEYEVFELAKYPNIFKELSWWEDREVKDLPKYLKERFNEKRILKANSYNLQKGKVNVHLYEELIMTFEPATEEEYLQFANQK